MGQFLEWSIGDNLPLTICAAFSSEIFLSFLLTNFDKWWAIKVSRSIDVKMPFSSHMLEDGHLCIVTLAQEAFAVKFFTHGIDISDSHRIKQMFELLAPSINFSTYIIIPCYSYLPFALAHSIPWVTTVAVFMLRIHVHSHLSLVTN